MFQQPESKIQLRISLCNLNEASYFLIFKSVVLLDWEIIMSQKYSGGAGWHLAWLSPMNVLIFIYLLVYKLVFLDAVSGTLYIILQKIKLNWA